MKKKKTSKKDQLELIKNLKEKIDRLGVAEVAYQLGYRSETAVWKWMSKKEIPECRIWKVKEFIECS